MRDTDRNMPAGEINRAPRIGGDVVLARYFIAEVLDYDGEPDGPPITASMLGVVSEVTDEVAALKKEVAEWEEAEHHFDAAVAQQRERAERAEAEVAALRDAFVWAFQAYGEPTGEWARFDHLLPDGVEVFDNNRTAALRAERDALKETLAGAPPASNAARYWHGLYEAAVAERDAMRPVVEAACELRDTWMANPSHSHYKRQAAAVDAYREATRD